MTSGGKNVARSVDFAAFISLSTVSFHSRANKVLRHAAQPHMRPGRKENIKGCESEMPEVG